MDDFVSPAPHRLTLSDGQFVDIRKRLNHGEREDMFARIAPSGVLDRRWVRTAKLLAYVIGWSLTKDGAPVPMSPDLPEQDRIDVFRALDPDRAVQIHEAIEAHETAMEQERAAQKKILSGSPAANATSALPSVPAGPSERSEP
jgi:hypothetical protein